LNRLHLLKASRDNSAAAFQHAYAAKNINPEGAYILNKLARMHLENNNKDSAAYYSNRAAVAAPNWPCVSIMSLPGISPGNKTNKSPGKQAVCKSGFGFTAGGGVSLSNPAYSGNSASGIVGVNSNTALTANLGFQYHACLGNTVNLRPTVTVIIENMNIDFSRRIQTGGPVTVETIAVKGTSFNIALPLIFRLSSKNIAPYFVFGPSYSYLVSQSSSSAEQIPVKKSLAMINGGLGVDIGLLRSGWIISPELKFSAGLSEMKDPAGTTIYAAALSSLKNNSISLNVYLRK
jgi:hypothetical protein